MADGFMKYIDAISNVFKRSPSKKSLIWSGRNACDVPCYPIKPLDPHVIGACTGPLSGLSHIQLDSDGPHDPVPAAGIANWNHPLVEADGISLSLYDHKAEAAGRHGDPNADVYAVIARPNSAILVVADGCNWGPKPRQAARCAANGSVQHLNGLLFGSSAPCNTQGVTQVILESFNSAQMSIVRNGGTTTTLCVAVVCELAIPQGDLRWGVCVVSVGDSPCFVWQSKARQVIEVTSAAHEGQNRDMRDSGGCLGANVGDKPDLGNLICSFALLSEGDIVFVTSDGVADNFDPVTLLEGVAQPTTPAHSASPPPVSLPVLTPDQRQAALLANLARIIECSRSRSKDEFLHAWEVMEAIVKHVIGVTDCLRSCMESSDFDNPALTSLERRTKELEVKEKLKTMRGKLDHATVAVYEVSCTSTNNNT